MFGANDRCDQENLLAQLQGGVRALRAPVDNLVSNWAYMVMTALAWNLKAWWALLLPEQPGRWQEKHRAEKRWVLGLEFKTFVNAFVRLPVPDRADGAAAGVSVAGLEPAPADLLPPGGPAALLRSEPPEVGVRMLRSATAPRATPQKGEARDAPTQNR